MKYLDKIQRGGKIDIKYNGTVQSGLPHGKGTMIFNGKRTFDGNFNNGKGIGTIKNPFGNDPNSTYFGYVNNDGLPNGLGHLWLSKLKTYYHGEFMNGQYHGYGKLEENGTEIKSKFENGKPVKSFYNVNVDKEVGNIIRTFATEDNELQKTVCDSCDTYIGEYPTGKGTMKFKNGDERIVKLQNGKQTMSFLEQKDLNLKQIQPQQSRSLGIKALAGVAGVAGLSYYLYNKFKKSSKRRAKSSSRKSSSRKSTRRSKHSEQSSLS